MEPATPQDVRATLLAFAIAAMGGLAAFGLAHVPCILPYGVVGLLLIAPARS